MKADLNLLPKKQRSTSGRILVVLLTISTILIGLIGYFFVFIPNSEKKEISIQVDEKQLELDKYIGKDEELAELNDEIADLKEMLNAVEGITSNFLKISGKLVEIEEAIPVDVILDSISYSAWYMDISGEAADYENIAQFMVNLRKTEGINQVSLYNAAYEDVIEDGEVVNIKYNFNIGINYGVELADIDSSDDEGVEGE